MIKLSSSMRLAFIFVTVFSLYTSAVSAMENSWLVYLQGEWSGSMPDCVVGRAPFYETKATRFSMHLIPTTNAVGDPVALMGQMSFTDYNKQYELFFEQIPQSKKFKVTVKDGTYQRRYTTDEVDDKLEFRSPQGDIPIVQFTLAKTYSQNPKEIQIFLSRREIPSMDSFTCSGVVNKSLPHFLK